MRERIKTIMILVFAFIVISQLYNFYNDIRPKVLYENASEESFSRLFRTFEHFPPHVQLSNLTVYDMQGKSHLLHEHLGNILVINFWATWCAPCVKEIPTLMKLKEAYSDKNIDVIFISLDFPRNPDELMFKITKVGIPNVESYYVISEETWAEFELSALPTSIIVNPEGEIRYKVTGDTNWLYPEVIDFLHSLL